MERQGERKGLCTGGLGPMVSSSGCQLGAKNRAGKKGAGMKSRAAGAHTQDAWGGSHGVLCASGARQNRWVLATPWAGKGEQLCDRGSDFMASAAARKGMRGGGGFGMRTGFLFSRRDGKRGRERRKLAPAHGRKNSKDARQGASVWQWQSGAGRKRPARVCRQSGGRLCLPAAK